MLKGVALGFLTYALFSSADALVKSLGGELPVKDGTHDHLIDALRYFYVNRRSGMITTGRRY